MSLVIYIYLRLIQAYLLLLNLITLCLTRDTFPTLFLLQPCKNLDSLTKCNRGCRLKRKGLIPFRKVSLLVNNQLHKLLTVAIQLGFFSVNFGISCILKLISSLSNLLITHFYSCFTYHSCNVVPMNCVCTYYCYVWDLYARVGMV